MAAGLSAGLLWVGQARGAGFVEKWVKYACSPSVTVIVCYAYDGKSGHGCHELFSTQPDLVVARRARALPAPPLSFQGTPLVRPSVATPSAQDPGKPAMTRHRPALISLLATAGITVALLRWNGEVAGFAPCDGFF